MSLRSKELRTEYAYLSSSFRASTILFFELLGLFYHPVDLCFRKSALLVGDCDLV